LNLAGSINSFGATIGPVILGKILFDTTHQSEGLVDLTSNVEAVKLPYILLGGLLILMAVIIKFTPLPKIASTETVNKKLGAFKFPQLTWGMLAIFLYVGVEVTIGSNLGELAQSAPFGGVSEKVIGTLVSLYWGSLMIGRWAGALDAFNMSKQWRSVLQFTVPVVAFLVIIGINALNGHDVQNLWMYLIWIAIFLMVQYWSGPNPARTLKIFGLVASLFLVVSMVTSGTIALYSMICAGLFCSVLWPCIFNIAIKGLGDMTNQGSSLLILMILGGAIVPLIQGSIIDLGVTDVVVGAVTYGQLSLVVGIVCFLYLSWYGHRFRSLVSA
jgi:FHS family L-fucose permease-like MFS transporter